MNEHQKTIDQSEDALRDYADEESALKNQKAALLDEIALNPKDGDRKLKEVNDSLARVKERREAVERKVSAARNSLAEAQRAAHKQKASELAQQATTANLRRQLAPHIANFVDHVRGLERELGLCGSLLEQRATAAAQAAEHASAAKADVAIPSLPRGYLFASVLVALSKSGITRRDLPQWLAILTDQATLAAKVVELCEQGAVNHAAPLADQVEACLDGRSIHHLPTEARAARRGLRSVRSDDGDPTSDEAAE